MSTFKTLMEFYESLNSTQFGQVNLVRQIILETEPSLEETLKWNALNFVYQGQDRLTFNLMNKEGKVKLIFHCGATLKENKKAEPVIQDPYNLIQWQSDIRGLVLFESLDQINSIQSQLQDLIQRWLEFEC